MLAVGPPRASARVLLVDRESQSPIIVEAATGSGRVTLMLADEAWRWTTPESPEATRHFWQDLAQTVVETPYDLTAGGLSLSLENAEVTSGRPVGVRARVANPSGRSGDVVRRTRRGDRGDARAPRRARPVAGG